MNMETENLILRARNILCYVNEHDAAEKLCSTLGVSHEQAFLAVKAASILLDAAREK